MDCWSKCFRLCSSFQTYDDATNNFTGDWIERQRVIGIGTFGNDYHFGQSLTISCNGALLLIGGPSRNSNQGAAYLKDNESSSRTKLLDLLPAWPSISQVAASLVQRRDTIMQNSKSKLEYWNKYESYCFKNTDYMICPATTSTSDPADRYSPYRWRKI